MVLALAACGGDHRPDEDGAAGSVSPPASAVANAPGVPAAPVACPSTVASSPCASTVGNAPPAGSASPPAAGSGAGGPAVATLEIGANLSAVNYHDTTPVFTNLMYQGFGYVVPNGSDPVPVDPRDGGPLSDFEAVTQYLPALATDQDVVFEIAGQAAHFALRLPHAGDAITSVGTYDPSTRAQRVTVHLAAGRPADAIRLQLAGTRRSDTDAPGTGVSSVIAARPGYSIEQLAGQRFTREYLRFVGPFKVLRAMDWLQVNGTQNFGQGTDFARRPSRLLRQTTFSYSESPDGTTAKRLGVTYEDLVDLANATGKDLWVNLPYYATDAYVTQLFDLLNTRLSGGQKVYVEWVNELWNSGAGFEQYARNLDDTARELHGFVDSSSRGGQLTRFATDATRNGGVVTLSFSAAHGFSDGQIVTIGGFDGISGYADFVVDTAGLAANQLRIRRPGADGAIVLTSAFTLIAPGTPSDLLATGARSVYAAAAFRAMRRIQQVSDLVRSVVGDDAMMTRYRPVFAWQAASGDFYGYLHWLEAARTQRPVSGYLYGIAWAPYYDLDGSPYGASDLRNTSDPAVTAADYVNLLATTAAHAKVRYAVEAKAVVALRFGIESLNYEGGMDTTGRNVGAVNNEKKSRAQLAPGIRAPLEDYVRDLMKLGTPHALYLHYAHGTGNPGSIADVDRFWTTDAIDDDAAPKLAALTALAGAPRPVPDRHVGPGRFDARLRAGKYESLVPTLLDGDTFPTLASSDLSVSRRSLDYLWTEPSEQPQARRITVTYTDDFAGNGGWALTIRINGVDAAVARPLSAVPADHSTLKTVGPFPFTAHPGQNGVELIPVSANNGPDVQIRAITID